MIKSVCLTKFHFNVLKQSEQFELDTEKCYI